MKKLYCICIILAFVATATAAHSADSAGHQQYRIITYNFNDLDKDNSDTQVSNPLLITGSNSDILHRNPFFGGEFGATDTQTTTSGFAVSAGFKATSKISLHGTIGITKNEWDAATSENYSSSWEANLGFEYKLFNNLSYEVHFGYMDPGDLFKQNSSYDSVESIVMISNKITMSF